jgi:polysaccharide pyruvyl transferase WcaK-like protein
MKNVGIAGTFDVENYGDCLFPVIAKTRLATAGFDTMSISPTSTATRWQDSAVSLAVSDLLDPEISISGALIGGGNIIHNHQDSLDTYVAHDVGNTAYASLWLGITQICLSRGIPVMWNAPGVPRSFTKEEQSLLIPSVIGQAAYVAVRDQASRHNLGPKVQSSVNIVLDTAVEISETWPKSDLEQVFKNLLNRKAFSGERRFFSVHVKKRSLQSDISIMAAMIDDFSQQTGLSAAIVALAPCHNDDETARAIGAALKCSHIVVNEALYLQEIAATIAFSEAYVGASLHGYITSYSYDVPSALVTKPNLPKFAGFMEHVERPGDIVENWQDAFVKVKAQFGKSVRSVNVDCKIKKQLDGHWGKIISGLNAPIASNYAKNLSLALQPSLALPAPPVPSFYKIKRKLISRLS